MSNDVDAKQYRREQRQKRMDAEARTKIRTRPATDAYHDGYERIFGKKKRRI